MSPDVLVLLANGQHENRYGAYLVEVLHGEGFNDVVVNDIAHLTPGLLVSCGTVILSRCSLDTDRAAILCEYVENGGRLIAIRPRREMLRRLGFETELSITTDGVLSFAAEHPVARGFAGAAIQIHGVVDHIVAGANTCVASVTSPRNGQAVHPGLLINQRGSGMVAVFTYDVGETIALLRQGDARLANTSVAGQDGRFRPSDLFVGYNDPSRSDVPQADYHANLLANLIVYLSPRPIVRLWYYPEPDQRSSLIMTSDDDWSKPHEFEMLREAVEAVGGACTFYLMENTAVTREQADHLVACGHALGIHPCIMNKEALNTEMRLIISQHTASFIERFGRRPRTTRNHCAQWVDYVGTAEILASLRFGMDYNYMNGTEYGVRFMTGSGRPLPFVTTDGTILDILQQASHMSEDGILGSPLAPTSEDFTPTSAGWTTAEAITHVADFLDDAVTVHCTPVCINSHPRSFASYSGEFVVGVFEHARRLGMPVVGADQWLDYTRARQGVRVSPMLATSAGRRFQVQATSPLNKITAMVSWEAGAPAPRVLVGGVPTDSPMASVHGLSYLMIPIDFARLGRTTVDVVLQIPAA